MSNDPVRNPYTPPSADSDIAGPGTIHASSNTNVIISLALVSGMCTLTGILLFLVVSKAEKFSDLLAIDQDDYLYLGIGFGICLVAAVASVVMRRQIKHSGIAKFLSEQKNVKRPSNDATFPGSSTLLGGYATANIVGGALLEGPAMINAILMMIDDNLWHLIPIAVAVVGILLTLPTASRMQHYVENAVSRS